MSAERSSAVSISGVEKSFGGRAVLSGVSLEVEEGSLTAILGASGSGKTTLLRLVAGLEQADRGAIRLAGRVVDSGTSYIPPERRNVGYVPQEGALFPHLTVASNISFGLRAGRLLQRPGASSARVAELVELVGLAGLERRYPHQLSGGERQRVALARALAPRPGLILLDEPFSSLDVALRTGMRREVVEVLRRAGTTAILVTHDQDEALSIADRVAVLRVGTIVQHDEPAVLYAHPVDADVARFVGHGNLLLGRLENGLVHSVLGAISVTLGKPASEPSAVSVLVRPEQVLVSVVGSTPPASELPSGVVISREFHGHDVLLGIRLDQPVWGHLPADPRKGWEVLARLPGAEAPDLGSRVELRIVGTAAAWPAGIV